MLVDFSMRQPFPEFCFGDLVADASCDVKQMIFNFLYVIEISTSIAPVGFTSEIILDLHSY